MSSCHKQSAAVKHLWVMLGHEGSIWSRLQIGEMKAAFLGCIQRSLWIWDTLVTGLQMQPSKDATPKLGRSTWCRWWPLLLYLKLSPADFLVTAVHVTLRPTITCVVDLTPMQHGKLHDSRFVRRLVLCERSLKTAEARILPEANVQKRSTWRRHRKIGSGKVWMSSTAKDLDYISWAQS